VSVVAEHRRTCPLCEAMCGLTIELRDGRVTSVRGDASDPFSRGYICPKGAALGDLQDDPDRLTQPVRRTAGGWEPISWRAALRETATRLHAVRSAGGDDAIAIYAGNPTTHNYSATLALIALGDVLGTSRLFSTASVDHLPHMLAAYLMFGHRALLPVPDLDRTDFLLVFGANPVTSNGSLMSAPGMRLRLRALRERGGRLVVVDPRRTRTAELADLHLAIRPGADALALLALLHVIFEEGLADLGHLAGCTDGLDELARVAADFPPERVAEATGLAADDLRGLARDFARAPRAVCYGRLGVCTQPFGTLCCWLIYALNAVTGNLDRPGGSMFTSPAADLVGVASLLGEAGSFGRLHTRTAGLPEFSGELPLAALADEMRTPGDGQIRALMTVAGNPVLSAPNGKRLDEALADLDFFVAIDMYINETTRHADIILPARSPLERDHYDLLLNAYAVRNVARYCEPALSPPPGSLEEWRALTLIARGVARRRGGLRGWGAAALMCGLDALTPRRVLAGLLLAGPHGLRRGRSRLSLRALRRGGATVDIGPLEGGRLRRQLATPGRRVRLAPDELVRDVARLVAEQEQPPVDLVLIGRRQLRSNNSWMHNLDRLVGGPSGCTLLMHPDDAGRLGLNGGDHAELESGTGRVVVVVEVSTEIRPGVVSLPHGYGHDVAGVRMGVAAGVPGASANAVTDELRVDAFSGTSALNGVPVTVRPAEASDASPRAREPRAAHP
jgi:anaerobic selenocysteine-containing dehydrogenase